MIGARPTTNRVGDVAMTAPRWMKDATAGMERCGGVFNNYPRITSNHASRAPRGGRCWPTASFSECGVVNSRKKKLCDEHLAG